MTPEELTDEKFAVAKELTEALQSFKKVPSTKGPYYAERFALEMRTVLDAMITERKDFEFLYDDYPTLSRTSLRLRVFQSLNYLVDHLDDAKQTYKRFRARLTVRVKNRSIMLRCADDPEVAGPLIARELKNGVSATEKYQDEKIRAEVFTWLDKANYGMKFERTDIRLSAAFQTEIHSLIHNVDAGILCKVTDKSIKVLKLEPEMINQTVAPVPTNGTPSPQVSSP